MSLQRNEDDYEDYLAIAVPQYVTTANLTFNKDLNIPQEYRIHMGLDASSYLNIGHDNTYGFRIDICENHNTRSIVDAEKIRFFTGYSTQKNILQNTSGTLTLEDITATNYHNLPSQ